MPSRRSRIRTAAVAAATAAAFGAAAAQAGAATVVTTPCVRDVSGLSNIPIENQRTMAINGTGFGPGSTVKLQYISASNPTPSFLTSADTDAAGNFSTTSFPASFASPKTQLQSFTLLANDENNPALAAVMPFQQVKLGYEQKPGVNSPRKKTRHYARGFVPGQPVYIHLRHHGKTRRTVKIGVAQGVCGIASKRMKALPTKARYGTWKFYVDQAKSFSLKTPLQIIASFTVTRTYL